NPSGKRACTMPLFINRSAHEHQDNAAHSHEQTIASLLRVTVQAAGLAQRFECKHDLAAVLAAGRGHQVLEIFWSVAQCCFNRGKALPLLVWRLGNFGLELFLRADRHGQVVAGLRTEMAVAGERWVERDCSERARHYEIAVGLEASRERPLHL